MSTPIKTIDKTLDQLQKEADDAIAALNAAKKRETEKELKGAKDDLEAAHKSFIALSKDSQSAFIDDEKVKELFASFGYAKRKTPKAGRGGGSGKGGGKFKKLKDAILAELATGPKMQKVLEEQFVGCFASNTSRMGD